MGPCTANARRPTVTRLLCCGAVLLIALHIFNAPQWFMQAMLLVRVLIRNTVDTYLDWYLGTKLDMLMNEHRVVRIIHLLHGTYRLYCSCTVS